MQHFYCEVLGCTVEKMQAHIGLTQLRAGQQLIDLVDVDGKLGREGGARRAARAAIWITSACGCSLSTAQRSPNICSAHGVAPGDVVSRYGAEGEGPSMYISDPEGNVVELKGPPGPVGR